MASSAPSCCSPSACRPPLQQTSLRSNSQPHSRARHKPDLRVSRILFCSMPVLACVTDDRGGVRPGGVGCPLSPTLRLLGQRQGAEAEHQPMMNAERGVVSRRTASILGASVLAGFAQQAAAMDWVPEAPKEGACAGCLPWSCFGIMRGDKHAKKQRKRE
eukprot:513707-Rhodomonas_salina.1